LHPFADKTKYRSLPKVATTQQSLNYFGEPKGSARAYPLRTKQKRKRGVETVSSKKQLEAMAQKYQRSAIALSNVVGNINPSLRGKFSVLEMSKHFQHSASLR
jgi:hypothetical protein